MPWRNRPGLNARTAPPAAAAPQAAGSRVGESKTWQANSHVVIWKQDRSITADTVRYNLQTKMAYAEGHVVLTAGSDILTGDYLENDMESEQGYITNGTIFIAKSNYHIQGDRIQKTGPESYTIGQAVDSSATVIAPGCRSWIRSFIRLRKAIASRFSFPPWMLGTHSPGFRE